MPTIEEIDASVSEVAIGSAGDSDEDGEPEKDVLERNISMDSDNFEAAEKKKKKGKGKKKKKKGSLEADDVHHELVSGGGRALASLAGSPVDVYSDAATEERKRYDSAQVLVNLYSNNTRLTPEQLAGRQRYAEDTGVWNPQTDLWLRDAVSAAQRHVKMMVVERRRLHDEKHPELPSSFNELALKYEFDPYHLDYNYGAEEAAANEAQLATGVPTDADVLGCWALAQATARVKNGTHLDGQALANANNSHGSDGSGGGGYSLVANAGAADGTSSGAAATPESLGAALRYQRAAFLDAEGLPHATPPPPPSNDDEAAASSEGGAGAAAEAQKGGSKKKKGSAAANDNGEDGSDDDGGWGVAASSTGEGSSKAGGGRASANKKKKKKGRQGQQRNGNGSTSGEGAGGAAGDDDEDGQNSSKSSSAANAMVVAQKGSGGGDGVLKSHEETTRAMWQRRRRAERLAREMVYTPWDMVAARLRDLHDVHTDAADCRSRYAVVCPAFEAQDDKLKEKQISVHAKRGAPSQKARGDAALAAACLSGRSLAVVELIVNSGAQIDSRSHVDGATPFLRACEGGNPAVVKCLLDKGADRLATTKDGRNGCHIAAQHKWPGLVEVLLDEGVPKCSMGSRGGSSREPCAKCKLTLKLIQKQRVDQRQRQQEQQHLSQSTGISASSSGQQASSASRASSSSSSSDVMRVSARTPEEKQAAIDAAMAAFEAEFGTFEDEVAAQNGGSGERGGGI